MRRLFFIAFSLLSLQVTAQREPWNPGVLVTAEGEVVTGDILFYPTIDVVMVRQGEAIKAVSCWQDKVLPVHDSRSNIIANSIPLPAMRQMPPKDL